MKWGVPAFAGGKFYLVGLKDSVNVGFSTKGLSKEELSLFDGTGKSMAHVKMESMKEFDGKRLLKLIKIVHVKS